MRKLITSLCMLMLCCALTYAQTRTVTGKVTDAQGKPVPFATVTVKGTGTAVSSDENGNFSIDAAPNSVLVFSASGFQSYEIDVKGRATISASMANQANLNEVVVTALGIKRKYDALSYSTQGIKSDRLTTTRMTDVNNALAGKIAGVQVRSQSEAKLGAGTSIRLRGAGSIVDKNPLYVVDGTPIDDINAINLDDVDDIQVLKGPAATALYGQRADAGVIMITMKKGKNRPGIGIEMNSSTVVNTVATLPKFQNEYSGGTPGVSWKTFTWDPSMPQEWKALDGQKYHTYFDDASWGPKMDGSDYIPWYAWYPGTQYSFKTAKLNPQPNNIRNFFDKGVQLINSISLSKAGENYNTRMSYTNQNENGLIPYSGLVKHSFSSQSSINLSSHLTANVNVNFFSQKVNGEFSDAYGNNASGSFNQWFHRDLDVNILRQLQDLRTPTGSIPGWNIDDENGITKNAVYGGTLYWTNPFTYFQLGKATRTTDRLFGDAGLTYKFNDHFKVAGTIRRSQLNQLYETKLPQIFENSTADMSSALSINENDPNDPSKSTIRPVRATYRLMSVKSVESNYEFLSSYNQKFGKFSVDVNAGGNIRKNSFYVLDNGTKGGLIIPDLFTLSNSKIQPFYYYSFRSSKEVRSLYGRGSIGYNDVITLDLSARNDWSSALPSTANSYLYPSVGTSLVLTKFIQPSLPWVSFAKLRGSWAQVGSDLDPYQLSLAYALGTSQWNGGLTMTTPDTLVNSNIKPALSSAYESGIDLRFLNNRISFSGTYYNETKINEIIKVPVTGTSGYSTQIINAGKIQRKGIELTLEGSPIRTKNLQWNIGLNYAKNKSEILDLSPGITAYIVGRSDYNRPSKGIDYAPIITHVVGGEWGQIRGRGIKRINGQPVIDPTSGLYEYQDNMNFGSVLPDFTGGFTNQLIYKNLILSFAIDFSKGGKYFSLSEFWGSFSGLYQNTVGLNDRGKPVRDPVSAGGGVHVIGVDDNKNKVDMYVDAIDYFQGNGVNKIHEMNIRDASFIKMRELSLSYSIPVKKLGKIGNSLQSLQVSAFARNPWLIYASDSNFDPSEFVGLYGETGQLPPSRSFGLTVKVGL